MYKDTSQITLLFGGRVSVFFDTKLRMKADLTALSNLARDTFLTAYKHPSCLAGCAPMTWMQTEAKLLMNSGRVGQRDQLVAQVKRYSEIMASHTRCQTYIDGALLIQRNAHALFDAWSAEFFKPENSDRDQIPFAYIAATTCPNIVELSPKRPCTNNLCHWYETEGVAKLVRHNFEADARCGEIQAEYGVLPLVSWGSAPPDAQREWRGLDCDARV